MEGFTGLSDYYLDSCRKTFVEFVIEDHRNGFGRNKIKFVIVDRLFNNRQGEITMQVVGYGDLIVILGHVAFHYCKAVCGFFVIFIERLFHILEGSHYPHEVRVALCIPSCYCLQPFQGESIKFAHTVQRLRFRLKFRRLCKYLGSPGVEVHAGTQDLDVDL